EVALGHERLTAPDRQRRVAEVLDWVGLGQRGGYRLRHLSGGQRQCVAIARALARRPRLILAEEPTARLDHESGRRLFELLRQRAREDGCTSLLVTRDHSLQREADRVIELDCGRVVKNEPVNGPAADTEGGHGSETGKFS